MSLAASPYRIRKSNFLSLPADMRPLNSRYHNYFRNAMKKKNRATMNSDDSLLWGNAPDETHSWPWPKPTTLINLCSLKFQVPPFLLATYVQNSISTSGTTTKREWKDRLPLCGQGRRGQRNFGATRRAPIIRHPRQVACLAQLIMVA